MKDFYASDSAVVSMRYMFQNCTSLTGSNNGENHFEISNVNAYGINADYMFQGCTALGTTTTESINLVGINTTGDSTMTYMFDGDKGLKNVTISGFKGVKNMTRVFSNCSNLMNADLSGIDFSKVTTMSEMFYGCNSLSATGINFGDNPDMSSIETIAFMINGTSSNNVYFAFTNTFVKWDLKGNTIFDVQYGLKDPKNSINKLFSSESYKDFSTGPSGSIGNDPRTYTGKDGRTYGLYDKKYFLKLPQ